MTERDYFSSPEEAAEYFRHLAIEYRFICYKESNPEGCHLLGEFSESLEQNIPLASKMYKYTCDKYGYGRSCDRYGTFLFLGKEMPSDIQAATNYFQKGCEKGFAPSCFHAGQILMGSKKEVEGKIEPKVQEALKLFEKSCNLELDIGCFAAHEEHFFAKNGTKQNLEKAFEYAEKGCNLNNFASCMNLQLMYKKGLGVSKNLQKMKEIQQKCYDLKKDEQKTIELQRTK